MKTLEITFDGHSAGDPPDSVLQTEDFGYYGYFRNSYGEQLIFTRAMVISPARALGSRTYH